MPLTVGTAGHIDHGKTWLVRALTGKDTDRLPEEQARGISIDLGYAPLELPGGRRMSLVDVPGHERFVRTMIAGATGIDLFLLVIDAQEGARPQTLEHLAVLRLLGVTRGVVAVTKSDAVDEETLELAIEVAHELVPDAEVIAVSAKTGAGLDDLRAALARVPVAERDAERATRLYVDRVFTLQGVGTIATGTLWSGTIAAGDMLRVEPRGRIVRVRSVQVHDAPVEKAQAGQRVAVNLPTVERRDLARGDPEEIVRTLVHAPIAGRDLQARGVLAPGELARGLAAVRAAGEHVFSDAWLKELRENVRARLAARAESDPLDPGVPLAELLPAEPWAPHVLNLLEVERRGAKAYLPGAAAALGERAQAATELEALLTQEEIAKVDDKQLAAFLEEAGPLRRVGDGFSLSTPVYDRRPPVFP